MSTGGGTCATGVVYTGSSSIYVTGQTISAIFGTGSTVVACGSHLHTGVYLPVCNPIATGTLCAPIAIFSTCSSTVVACASTSVISPLVCGTTKVCTPFLAATTCACSPIVNGTTCSTTPISCATTCSVTPMACANNITLTCNEGTAVFTSGFAGSGWQLTNPSGEATLTVDNIYVRKNMTVYELDINKINSINGGLMVSAANGTVYCVSGNKLYFDEDNGSKPFQFQCNDWVRAQVWTGRGICSYIGLVTGVTHSNTLGSAYASMSSTCTGWKNMELVQAGNSTCAARQNLIYITASDSCNPYIDMLAGVTGCTFTGKQKLRIGNLAGITDASFGGALTGYGLYGNNVYLKGSIVIAAGSSGYANMCDKPTALACINSTESTKLAGIAAGATNVTNTNQLTDGANLGGTAAWGGISSVPAFLGGAGACGLYMGATCMGFYNGSSWTSYIDNTGAAKFINVVEFGTGTAPINLGNGYGAVAIKGNEIWENSQCGVGTLIINGRGFQGGTTQARFTIIGDGCGNSVASFSAAGTEVCGGLRIDGSTLAISTITSCSTMTATNFILSSDERLKQCIQPINIKPINVDYKEFEMCNDAGQKRYGVVAQSIQEQYPELIRTDKDGVLSVAYIDLLIREVATLKCKVKDLEQDLNYMRNYNC